MTSDSFPEIKLPVYLDYCATTPMDPRVLSAMLPYFSGKFGNASSRGHSFGWDAQEAVENARSAVARLIHASTADIFFTSGATESVNLGIKGAAQALKKKGNHIITTAVEHSAVLETCKFLETEGFGVTYLPVDSEGSLDMQELMKALRETTILIAIMHANNQTGVIFPISEIGRIAREHDVPFFSDTTQTVGKLPIDFPLSGVGLAAFSGHKFYGPKGVGALYIGNTELKQSIAPLIHGGGQERNLRSGTLNVPAIVGFGEACRIAEQEMAADEEKAGLLRDMLEKEILRRFPGAAVNGGKSPRLPHVSNVSFAGVDARELLRKISTVAVSTSSACSSGSSETSHVLKAMGKSEASRRGAVRFSCGRFSLEREIRFAIDEFQI
jgi:cysteine desulfurase